MVRPPLAWLSLAVLALAACKAEPGRSDPAGEKGGDEALEPFDVEATVSEYVSTVVIVRWSTAEETTGYVEFGETTSYGLTTNTTAAGTAHEVLLLGMTADTEVHFRVIVQGEGDSFTTGDYAITTGSLPTGLPSLSTTGTTDDWNYQVVPIQGTAYALTIINNEGEYIWYYAMEPGGNLMRAYVSADRQSVVLCHAGDQDSLEDGRVTRISLDGGTVEQIDFPYVDHDMVELPDGTIGAIVVETRDGWAADRIVELAPDGTQTEVWNAWDSLDPTGYGLEGEHNWTHANAIDYDPDNDLYYLSTKAIGTILKIDRPTGQIEWKINGKMNEFTFSEDSEMVMMSHQFERLDNGNLLVFDNGPADRGYSRVVEFEIDEAELTADQVWDYIRDPPVYVFAKGDVARFDSGNTQVVWSPNGEIQNITPEGEVYWTLNTELGEGITFVQIVDDLYARE